jgi:dCTP deaminase
MYLSREAILKAIDRGDINVSPFEPELLGAASLDLRLDRAFRRLEVTDSPLDLTPEKDYRDPEISTPLVLGDGESLEIASGETVLGITLERLTLSPRICGRLEGRSRFARLGLLIHISASFVAPGTDNQQVLEIANLSPRPLRLHPGVAIGQCVFARMEGQASHQGRYRRQTLEDFIASP